MKVTKNMLHRDLKSNYDKYMLIAKLLSNKNFVVAHNLYLKYFSKSKKRENIKITEESIVTQTNNDLKLKIYKPENVETPIPLFLYIHGGGYITGNPEMYEDCIEKFINKKRCIIVSPKYRKAFEEPYPAAINDCYDSLLWAKNNHGDIGIYKDRFIVGGPSAGGGLTTATSLLVRNKEDIDIAFQLPIYPMIDCTQPYDVNRYIESPMWGTASNRLGWEAYLSNLYNNNLEIPSYASVSKENNLCDLPPTISLIGTLDPFYIETKNYIEKLKESNVPVEFAIFEGCFHAFDIEQPNTNVAREAEKFILDKYASYYEKYITEYKNVRKKR